MEVLRLSRVICGLESHLCVLKNLTGTTIASNLRSVPQLAKFDFGNRLEFIGWNEAQPMVGLVFSLKSSAFIQA